MEDQAARQNNHRVLGARSGHGESHQSKNSQRTEATRQRESNGKNIQGEFRDVRASDQPQTTTKRSEQRDPQDRGKTGENGLKNKIRGIQGKTHQSRATPDKSSDLREELRANGNKGKRLEPGEADKQPSQDVRKERDRAVAHPPPN